MNRVTPAPLRAGCLAAVPAASASACFSSSVCRRASSAAAFAAALLLSASVANAQYTANYQTNTYDGAAASTNWVENYYVGSNTHHDVLQVLNGAGLTNAAGSIGQETSASNNLVVVSGSGSIWNNTGALNVGNFGARNQLIISNGGVVMNTTSYVGGNNSGAISNQVVVTGAGSVWSNGSIHLGYRTVGN